MARTKAASKKTQLPKGYDAITGFTPSWPNDDTKVGDMIEGVLLEFDEFEIKRGNKMEDAETVKIECKDGTVYTLWRSAGLSPLWDYDEETQAAIIYRGMGKAKKGQNPPRLYEIGVK